MIYIAPVCNLTGLHESLVSTKALSNFRETHYITMHVHSGFKEILVVFVHVCVYLFGCVYIYMSVSLFVCMHACLCMCVCESLFVHLFVCVCVSVCLASVVIIYVDVGTVVEIVC